MSLFGLCFASTLNKTCVELAGVHGAYLAFRVKYARLEEAHAELQANYLLAREELTQLKQKYQAYSNTYAERGKS
jgi:hypothetical protein